MAKNTAATMQKVAEDYGYQLAFLKSDPELYSVFQKAVAGTWDATRFVAAVKNTKWYKTHGEAYRQNLALKTTDPGTYQQNLQAKFAEIGDLAASMGASSANISKLADQALMFGWNDSQIKDALSKSIVVKGGAGQGAVGQMIQQLKETAYRNGVNTSDGWFTGWAQRIASGNGTIEDAQRQLRSTYGAALAPGFKKELDSGMDLYDLASPYMQSMAKTLEMNPADVNLFDPTIRKAMSSSGAKDGKPGSVPLWQFESDLKKDPRWLSTNNARDQLVGTTQKLLQDFGLSS